MDQPRTKPFNYAVGMFGTSIPINMLKTYAAIYYVDKLGMTTAQFALMLLIIPSSMPSITRCMGSSLTEPAHAGAAGAPG